MADNSDLCMKKDGNGQPCKQSRGHTGPCRNDEHFFVPGLIDQGDRPARRKLMVWIFCAGIMYAMLAFLITVSPMGWIAVVLLTVALAIGAPEIRRMVRLFKAENAKMRGRAA